MFGIAISATVYGVITASGNIDLAAMIGLLTNVGFCLPSLIAIIVTVPRDNKAVELVTE
ncbi:major facilitator family transporter [Listeria riparia FSL S10-1204]|uniref:Major facilitator family transporter n=1 Tax=Listeria riparia FSL S10-1204 TaxID=1265816 RepID=W7DHB0_9LIST|nr:major facilitator family transporter [Listeria riparia FSL S10-1204]